MLKENYCLFNTNGNEIAQLNKTRNACQRNSLSEHKRVCTMIKKIRLTFSDKKLKADSYFQICPPIIF